VASGDSADEAGRGEKPGVANHISLKEAIVRAAIELGTELGEEGLTMRGIAARLGVSATALYQHFEGKASILRAIRFHGLSLMNKSVAPAFEREDPLEQIRESALLYINFARSNPWLYALLFGGEIVDYDAFTDAEREVASWSQFAAQRAFERGKELGKLRADLDVVTAPFLMWAANHGVAMLLITRRISEQNPAFPIPNENGFIRAFVESEVRGFMPMPSGS
jgi:AcrR family transcriptional regulator